MIGSQRIFASATVTLTIGNIAEEAIRRTKEQVGDDEVVLGLSGGVDSSVVAAILSRAIGDQLTCIFVDNGLLRKDISVAIEKALDWRQEQETFTPSKSRRLTLDPSF